MALGLHEVEIDPNRVDKVQDKNVVEVCQYHANRSRQLSYNSARVASYNSKTLSKHLVDD